MMCKNRGMETMHETGAFCPLFHHAIELIGRRWTGAILRALNAGTDRFSALTQAIPGLSDRLLSERLKELEAEGIVQRVVLPTTPVTITYRLTEKGKALGAVMDAVSEWAAVWLMPQGDHADGAADIGGTRAAGE